MPYLSASAVVIHYKGRYIKCMDLYLFTFNKSYWGKVSPWKEKQNRCSLRSCLNTVSDEAEVVACYVGSSYWKSVGEDGSVEHSRNNQVARSRGEKASPSSAPLHRHHFIITE